MATHKVPQDVEAEDKLIGFLSLRQFIFVIIGLVSGWLGFVFATRIHPLAALVWLPTTVVFLVLGLYQRRDQPVEVFLASALRFYLKPRVRRWDQEGYEERVIITAPPKYEKQYTKSFSGEEASSRLSVLSHLMDTRGWATKMATTNEWQNPQLATAAASERLIQPSELRGSGFDVQQFMQQAPDVMDENSSLIAQSFESRIAETGSAARLHAMQAIADVREHSETPEIMQPDAPASSTTAPTPAPTVREVTSTQQNIAPQPDAQINVPNVGTAASPAKPIDSQAPQPLDHTNDTVEIKLH